MTARRTIRASDGATRREHRRLARAKLAELRAKLRAAVDAKKRRMKEIVIECRTLRLAAREEIRAMWTKALGEIREDATRERATAREECLARKRQARQDFDSAVAVARAELAAERKRQADEQRIAREERARHATATKAHATNAAHHAAHVPMVARLAPLAARAAASTQVGESRAEGLLRYAETHPDEAHAVLHPAGERAIAEAHALVDEAARVVDAPSAAELEHAARSANRRRTTAGKGPAVTDPGTGKSPRAPNAYEAKRAGRVGRMRTRADRLEADARVHEDAVRAAGDRTALLGHRGEKRYWRGRKQMDRHSRASFDLQKSAESLRRRAKSAETSTAISGDDPEALPKLRTKLAELEATRVRWKAAHAAIRAGTDTRGALEGLGVPTVTTDTFDAMAERTGKKGIPAYVFQNLGAEVRRVMKRIKELEQRAVSPARAAETIGGAEVSEADNRVRVAFPSKPPEPLRRALKGAGFRWAPSLGVWQRRAGIDAWTAARRVLGEGGR